MISFCTLVRDVPHIEKLIDYMRKKCPVEFEVCIGDNSVKEENIKIVKELADVYVRITDKELYRMGIPWGHNRVVSEANTYKIVYLDSDEYPIWIRPNIEERFEINYVLGCLRGDFFSMEEIEPFYEKDFVEDELKQEINVNPIFQGKEWSMQDRVYNSRYAKFDGVCHSIFHVPYHFRSRDPDIVVMHNKTVRDAKNIDRMRSIIREQYSRMVINSELKSSNKVMEWAIGWAQGRKPLHQFENYEKFKEYWDDKEG